MPRQFSNQFNQALNSVNSCEIIVTALEITSPKLASPIRITNGGEDVVSNGDTYIFCPYEITMPDDVDSQLPKSRLRIANIGRDIIRWIDQSQGGEDVQVRLLMFLKSDPNKYELDICLFMDDISISTYEITASLGYNDILNKPAVAIPYNYRVAPGLF